MATCACILGVALVGVSSQAWAQSSPFTDFVGKFITVIEDLKLFVVAAISGVILWTLVELARGNGMAWGKLGMSVFGLFIISQYDGIIRWFGGYTP